MPISSKPPSERRPARIAPLSVLPVFFSLTGKRAVVAGSSDAAVWKAELLAAAGVEVHIFAASPAAGGELARLLASDETGRLVHHEHDWNEACLRGASIAVADAEDQAEAERFVDAARQAGVPVNVIDRPACCDFQFGSIVNRSPVVVGISSTGAAPILAQAIRRRIETLLPPALADWAALAARLRETVQKRLAPGAARRAFWERFAGKAFCGTPDDGTCSACLAELSTPQNEEVRPGRVTLVGAGPGDAALLTIKAVSALQGADVILFDELVSDEVLELARREAKHILVGKRGGRASCRQDEINALMLKLARAGRNVVRLKSGDPMVFGRAGEELAELEAAGIPVEIVPGITAALSLAAALGVSLTHRDCAKSVRLITGHSKAGGLPEEIDWRSVADSATSTVFYMGGGMAGRIGRRLIAEGLPAATPVVAACSLSRPEQRIAHGTLADLKETVAKLDADGAPVLIGVGAVFVSRRAAHAPVATGLPFKVAQTV